jgi:hypothetical protein
MSFLKLAVQVNGRDYSQISPYFACANTSLLAEGRCGGAGNSPETWDRRDLKEFCDLQPFDEIFIRSLACDFHSRHNFR